MQKAGPVLPLSRAVSLSNDWGAPQTTNLDATGKKGYLIFLQNARTCQVTGEAIDPTVTLNAGWNFIGVTSSTFPANNNRIWPWAYYVDSAGVLQATSIYVNGLQPGVGYFIACAANNVTLVSSTGASQLAQNEIKVRTESGISSTSIGTEFSCQITVSQSNAGASPGILNFGMKPGATDDYDDSLDELAANPMPGNMCAKFDESFGLKSNYKATSSSVSWPLVVRSESPDTGAVNTNPMIISWTIPLTGAVDQNALFQLLDSDGNVLVSDMKKATQTSFLVAASSTERHFTIRASLVGPSLSVTPSGDLLSGGNPGGPFSPPSQTFTINNAGVGTLNWTVSADQNWVTVTPNSGSNAGTVTIAINANANSLAGGAGGVLYTATLTFAGNGGTVTRHMNLVVYEGNRAPQVAPSTPQGIQSGGVPIWFRIYDDESDLCTLQVLYSTNGGSTWNAAKPIRVGSCAISGLSSSPNGEDHLYVWDSVADIGYVANDNIKIQLTPTDPGGNGSMIATYPFTVNNTAVLPPPTPVSPGAASSPGPVILENRLAFTWTAVPGAAGYRCYAYEENTLRLQWDVMGGATNINLVLSAFPRLAKIQWFTSTINSNGVVGAASSSSLYFQAPAPNISVTVKSIPSGRSFMVDNISYNNMSYFSWVPGSDHTISTTSPQGGAAGSQYVWKNWNDGLGMSHIVAPTNSTNYIANFTTQFNLTMNIGTGGDCVSPGSAWYDSGMVVTSRATAESSYVFSSWIGSGAGSYSGTDNPATITMDGPINATANFEEIGYTCTTNNGVVAITGYNGYCGNLVVFKTINGLPVTSIGCGAFSNNASITSIVILGNITNIGASAFASCPNLTDIYFVGNAPSLGTSVFAGGTPVTIYYMPDTTGWGTFNGPTPVLWNPAAKPDGTFGIQTNMFGFTITNAGSPTIVVEASTNLVSGEWVPVSIITLKGGSSYFSDSEWTNYHGRFYRFRAP